MSVAATSREYVMQNPGCALEQVQSALVWAHPKTVRRALEYYVSCNYLRREDERFYPPDNFPSGYFLDDVLLMMYRDSYKWSAVENLAHRVPVAGAILRQALRAVQELGLVVINEDGQYARLTALAEKRCGGGLSAREITRLWKPPRGGRG